MRHEPSQKRSSDKVEEILKAAEALILEKSLEEITTTMIAERANVTRTSMYHFFPSKIDVMDALASRYHAQLRERVIAFFEPGAQADYHQAWSGIAGVYKKFFDEVPAAAILLLGKKGAKQAIYADSPSEDQLATEIGQMMYQYTNISDLTKGQPPEPDFFQFVLTFMKSLFSASVRREGEITQQTEKEIQKATLAYMETSLKER